MIFGEHYKVAHNCIYIGPKTHKARKARAIKFGLLVGTWNLEHSLRSMFQDHRFAKHEFHFQKSCHSSILNKKENPLEKNPFLNDFIEIRIFRKAIPEGGF